MGRAVLHPTEARPGRQRRVGLDAQSSHFQDRIGDVIASPVRRDGAYTSGCTVYARAARQAGSDCPNPATPFSAFITCGMLSKTLTETASKGV